MRKLFHDLGRTLLTGMFILTIGITAAAAFTALIFLPFVAFKYVSAWFGWVIAFVVASFFIGLYAEGL